MKTLFIGNPGVGKSTLLNGIIGEAKFKSGVAFGTGMTRYIQLHQDKKTASWYGDTPGLADSKRREQAAAEITKALKSGDDDYRIVFVVTEEAGRVRPADVVTMTCVLDALSSITITPPYGIIVNKISKKKIEMMHSNPQARDAFATCLNDKHITSFIHFYEHKPELDDENDKVHQVSNGLLNFLMNLPPIRIKPEHVQDVKVDQYQEMIEEMEERINALLSDNEKLEARIKQNEQRHGKELQEYKEDVERQLKGKDQEMKMLRGQLQSIQKESSRQAAELKAAQERARRAHEEGKNQEMNMLRNQLQHIQNESSRQAAELKAAEERSHREHEELRDTKRALENQQQQLRLQESNRPSNILCDVAEAFLPIATVAKGVNALLKNT